ncbi:MAG: hypothetical protein KJO41_07570 [Bacteroidia bacterium]|nr:hypothetical protein [Bacteroidia bacterium]NND25911.1 hypothetical protein [Flavobacteriaceae bacterium]MBT8278845.1 hypothetical protein [Bacteroidia bacterium]NNK60750.1 hypothetical protein [Flavobacteriaceae bacterium]NNL33559.1 hypothetical protein [Flavobacteriaceae bacterium]
MQKLQAANLYRSELIPISGKLVDRYNDCLRTLGFKPTKLKNFSIDGIGWSPEIAEERKNVDYLNHGDANPHGIIISPLQKGKPVYIPFHSFDKDMMKFIFKTYEKQINDITRDCAICLDFDQNIDAFYEPLDVLKYDQVKIAFRLINDLDKIQQEQLDLIEKFKSNNNFIDETIHEELLQSAKKHGDLRNRELVLAPILFETNSFFTRAFGGVFILRDFISTIIVFIDEESHKEAIKDTAHDVLIYHISQSELMDKLRDHLIIECELEDVVKTKRYERIKKFMFYKELAKTEHPIKDILSSKILFKSYLNKIEVKALKRVNGVEIYLERLERSNAYKIPDLVSQDFYHALHQPHSSLDVKHQDLIWKLLVNVSPRDVLFLYWYDKQEFYTQFEAWDESFQDWVIETISNNI